MDGLVYTKNMKNILLFILLLCGLGAQAQTDTVIYYGDSINVYRIDTAIVAGNDTITSDSNYVVQFYHYIQKINDTTYIYQPQFVVYDSLINRLLPNIDLEGGGWRSSGTVKEFTVDSNFINLTPVQMRDSLILPDLKLIYGAGNVTKL